MSFEGENDTLEARMRAQWALVHNDIPVIYDNSPIAPPTSGTWLRFEIHGADGNISGIGGSKTQYTTYNFISIIVYVKKGTGTKTAKGYADDAAAIFRGWITAGYKFRAPWVKDLGEALGWYRVAITIPFTRDEIFS